MKQYTINHSLNMTERLKCILPMAQHSNYLHSDHIPIIHFTKGQGSRLWDVDGNEYLDLDGKHGSQFLGHQNNVYTQYLTERLHRVLSVNSCDIDYEVCDLLRKHVPSCEMVRFSLSGSEAIQNAFRLAKAATEKTALIKFYGHFHGTADRMLTSETHDTFMLEWNDIIGFEEVVQKNHQKIAAVIMEAVCMSSGGILADIHFLQQVRKACDKYNIILIFDEVITGIRSGLGGIQKKYNVIPDISIFSKCLGNGIPISAVMGKRSLFEHYVDYSVIYGGTYNGYPLGLTAIYATYKILMDCNEKYYEKLSAVNDIMIALFYELARNTGLDLSIQGEENCYTINIAKYPLKSIKEWTSEQIYKNNVLRACLQRHGILISGISRIYPSIALSENDLDFARERFNMACIDARKILKKLLIL